MKASGAAFRRLCLRVLGKPFRVGWLVERHPDHDARRGYRQVAIFYLDNFELCGFWRLVVKTGPSVTDALVLRAVYFVPLDVHIIPRFLRQFGLPRWTSKYSRAVFRHRSSIPIGQILSSSRGSTAPVEISLTLKKPKMGTQSFLEPSDR